MIALLVGVLVVAGLAYVGGMVIALLVAVFGRKRR